METRDKEALAKRQHGYNCAQAVFCTYCEDFGMSEQIGYKLSEAFGSGMGGLKETCGAVSAMFMLAGLANGDGELASHATRAQTYALVQEMASAFQTRHTNLKCFDIMHDFDDAGNRKHPCIACVVSGAQIVEEYIYKNKGVK